jgi:hypothetical protein
MNIAAKVAANSRRASVILKVQAHAQRLDVRQAGRWKKSAYPTHPLVPREKPINAFEISELSIHRSGINSYGFLNTLLFIWLVKGDIAKTVPGGTM